MGVCNAVVLIFSFGSYTYARVSSRCRLEAEAVAVRILISHPVRRCRLKHSHEWVESFHVLLQPTPVTENRQGWVRDIATDLEYFRAHSFTHTRNDKIRVGVIIILYIGCRTGFWARHVTSGMMINFIKYFDVCNS